MARIASTTSAGVPVDPTGGMTLDALMARQKALAEAQGQIAAPRNIQSSWQGAAQMLQAFVNARQGSYAEDQLTAGREALAKIRAGINLDTGPTSEQISQASMLDPDYADRLTGLAADAVRARRQREQQIADRNEGRTYQEGQTAATRQYEAGQEAAIDTRELGQAAAVDQRELAQAQAATKAQQDFARSQQEDSQQAARDAATAKAAEPNTTEGKIIADFNRGAYGDPASPDAAALRDQALKKATAIPTPAGVNADRKALWGQQDAYVGTASSIGKLKRASELLGQGINTGYTAGLRTMYGNAGMPGGDPEAANRSKEFNAIMTGEAITAMSEALKGATTDTEMARFIEIMNDPTVDPTVKQRQIDTMLAKAQSFNELQGARIKELGGEVPQAPAGPGSTDETKLLDAARAAIAKGADAQLVRKRLADRGIDPGKL